MSERNEALVLFQTELQAMVGRRRVVTRNYMEFVDRPDDDLRIGIFTILSKGVRDLANAPGRMAMYGNHQVLVVGQIKLDECATGEQIEAAEFELFEDIATMSRRALPEVIGGTRILGFQQSQQLEHPYGWVAIDIEIGT